MADSPLCRSARSAEQLDVTRINGGWSVQAEVGEGAGCGEEPLEGPGQLGWVGRCLDDVPLDVLDGSFEHGDPVVQLVEALTCDHQLGVTEAELPGARSRFEVTLTTAPATERPGSAGAAVPLELPPAPPAPVHPRRFRHSDETSPLWWSPAQGFGSKPMRLDG